MKKLTFILFVSLLMNFIKVVAQDSVGVASDSLSFNGQISCWGHFNPNNTLPVWGGGRVIPQLNYEVGFSGFRKIDFEASANAFGSIGLNPFDTISADGKIKPYRLWGRFSGKQFEVRLGLQKINFGSASLLRPLMWFDQIDPRDPLQLTDGVWGLLARYYFLNNANIWFWTLYGNENPKGWEAFGTIRNIPEFGGRIQTPVPKGEAGLSYHHRVADYRIPSDSEEDISENRFGFDAKFDMVVGWWFEASWSNFNEYVGMFSNQEIINLGVDYTFGLGNGITVIYEQLIAAYDENPFEFSNKTTFSLINLTYPIGMFDNLSAVFYYDWTNNKIYNFVNWQRQFNRFSLYLMGYINPKDYSIPTQNATGNLYAGSGVQIMAVFNY